MNASVLIGRVGALAVALGLGSALFADSGMAWAGPDPSTASGTAENESGPGLGATNNKALRAIRSAAASTAPHVGNFGNDGRLTTRLGTLRDNVGAHLSARTE